MHHVLKRPSSTGIARTAVSAWMLLALLPAALGDCPGSLSFPNQVPRVPVKYVPADNLLWKLYGSFDVTSSTWPAPQTQAACCARCCTRPEQNCYASIFIGAPGRQSCALILSRDWGFTLYNATGVLSGAVTTFCAWTLPAPLPPALPPPSPPPETPVPMAPASNQTTDMLNAGNPQQGKRSSSSSFPLAAIIAIAAGGGSILLCCLLLVFFLYLRRRSQKASVQHANAKQFFSGGAKGGAKADICQDLATHDAMVVLGRADGSSNGSRFETTALEGAFSPEKLHSQPIERAYSRHSKGSGDHAVFQSRDIMANTLNKLTGSTWSQSSSNSFPVMAELDTLQRQLDWMHKSGTLLCNRFRLGDRKDRRVGGQGIVQFCTLAHDARKHFAIKFYLDRASFDAEQAWFKDETLHSILPIVDEILDNTGSSTIVLGKPLPPMVIIEKGESLVEYQRRSQPDFISSMQIMVHLVQRVAAMHDVGIVHRDLKPANVIFYPSRNEWTLIDFGSAARMGTTADVSCTMGYAAPETVQALCTSTKEVVADTAVDVWSLGVIAWELFTHSRVFLTGTTRYEVEATMNGEDKLPWERVGEAQYEVNMRKLGFVKDGVLRMVARNPRERITLQEVASEWRAFMNPDSAA